MGADRADLPPVFRRRRSEDALVDLSILTREQADVYHARRAEFLSSHQLAEFRRNPPLYRKRQLGLVLEEDRPAYLIGHAAHSLEAVAEGMKMGLRGADILEWGLDYVRRFRRG